MAFQLQLPTALEPLFSSPELDAARAEQDRLSTRWVNGADFLDELARRKGQDDPEYTRYFAEWLKIDAQYKTACDRVAMLEHQEQMLREGVPTLAR